MRNASPYLQQHSTDLVRWRAWDGEALDLARRENKPILLAIGYSACHWCHVMAEESFRDPDTAALINEHFVSILVDREERPDLDNIYQTALAGLGERRGWPLTMFLTPEGEPFGGGTYFPREARDGRAAFRDVLHSMAEAFARDPGHAVVEARRVTAALKPRPAAGDRAELSTAFRNYAADQLLDGIDVVYGGFGTNGPKFPSPMPLELVWRAYARTGRTAYRDAVVLSVDQMARGGIYDALGGGFHRYATDDAWLVPHFEKMLYDNALLIELLTLLWQDGRQPLFARCIAETVGWVLREMATSEGAFAATLAADTEGYDGTPPGEGVFYLWRAEQIDALLGDDAALFDQHYDVQPGGNWAGWTILNRSRHGVDQDAAVEAALARARATLWRAREGRPRPARDDKVLADWNGLMIGALANAGMAFGRPEWLSAAAHAFAFVCRAMADGRGRLCHSWFRGRRGGPAVLDDYAHMAGAALRLFEATGRADYLEQAEVWAALVDAHHRDAAGGYFLTADDTDHLITRIKSARETATPSGNGAMVDALARLYLLTGEAHYRERAATTVSACVAEAQADYFATASLINRSELLHDAVQVVLIGAPGTADTQELRRAVFESCVPNRVLAQIGDTTGLPPRHPAHGKTSAGRATAYVCIGTTCGLPMTDPADLRDALASPRARSA